MRFLVQFFGKFKTFKSMLFCYYHEVKVMKKHKNWKKKLKSHFLDFLTPKVFYKNRDHIKNCL